ncbi:hypothetical protein [Rubrolithibacter danxiaensis]|uniref:hypothetical protein n=1 Tax=Rubrolithibacter danxiaensis TaxID=3390805 RepID=UPI003BF89C95
MAKTQFRTVKIVLFIILTIPFWMWLCWYFSPKHKLVVAIIDKTVLSKSQLPHASLTWILRNNRYTKTSSQLYTSSDYFGTFPAGDGRFKIKGLERLNNTELNNLSAYSDIAYITDTYGLNNTSADEAIQASGGLSPKDLTFLKAMKQRKKLVIAEFNTFASPTLPQQRKDFEDTFKIKWTGWVGKYFSSLDTLKNKDLPKELVNNYKKQHFNKWPFSGSGIVFLSKENKIVVLENGSDLTSGVPYIVTQKIEREKYNVPKTLEYPFWFDVIETSRTNTIVSFYDIRVTKKGLDKLASNGLSPQFPAIIKHTKDYNFFYLAGDFADNTVCPNGASFKGISIFRKLFYNNKNASDQANFFWAFYNPFMSKVLDDYSKSRN